MTMPIDVVLARHGESEGNVARRFSLAGDNSVLTEEFCARTTRGCVSPTVAAASRFGGDLAEKEYWDTLRPLRVGLCESLGDGSACSIFQGRSGFRTSIYGKEISVCSRSCPRTTKEPNILKPTANISLIRFTGRRLMACRSRSFACELTECCKLSIESVVRSES
jgi:hypothetical protein